MADKQTVGELVYKVTADATGLKGQLNKTDADVKNLAGNMEKASKSTAGFGSSLKKLAATLGLVYLAKLAFDFGKASVQAYANAQSSIMQFNNAQQNVVGTTKEQIESLNEYIYALEKKTTVDDKSIRQAAQILAQDQISIENQKKLLAGVVDLAVANSKQNGQEIDVAGTGRAIGLAFAEGSLSRLIRQNVAGITEAQKKLFELGDESQRTAILMEILEKNAKGAGDALGASLQGKINRGKDAVEELQIAVGRGLTAAFTVFSVGLGETVGDLEGVEGGTQTLGKAMVYVAGLVNFMINTIKLFGIMLIGTGHQLYSSAKIAIGWGKDMVGVFGQVGKSIKGVANAVRLFLSGDIEGAGDAIKEAFTFDDVFNNTKKALDESKAANAGYQKQLIDTARDMRTNVETMANAGEVYRQTAAANDALTAAKNAEAKAAAQAAEATEAEIEAAKKLQAESDALKEKLLGVLDSLVKMREELNGDLTEAFKKFNDDLKESFGDGTNDLATIVLDAQDRIKELKKELSNVEPGENAGDEKRRLRAEIKEQEEILKSRKGFEERQAATVAEIRKRLTDAGIDAEKEGLDALTNIASLEAKLKDERALRDLDEFAREEELQKRRMLALTDTLIAEVTTIREKITQQEGLEAELTAYLQNQNLLRAADVDAFAAAAIKKYGAVANELQRAVTLQQRLNTLSAPKRQFALGGYTGSTGGEVHPGEYVIPPGMVSSMSGLVAMLEKIRTGNIDNSRVVNAPINIQSIPQDGLDFRTVGREIAWELGGR